MTLCLHRYHPKWQAQKNLVNAPHMAPNETMRDGLFTCVHGESIDSTISFLRQHPSRWLITTNLERVMVSAPHLSFAGGSESKVVVFSVAFGWVRVVIIGKFSILS